MYKRQTENLATLQADKWYKVRITLDNNFEEYSAVVTDVETGKVCLLYTSGVGEGLKTKINVNLGISKDCTDYSIEWEKVKDVYKRQVPSPCRA